MTRNTLIVNDVKVLPRYELVSAAKSQCRPEAITISTTCADVSWKSLLSHTVKRIISSCEDAINQDIGHDETVIDIKFFATYGYDGSSGHITYHQSLNDSSKTSSSLFSTHMNPIQLKSSSGKVYWQNESPSSMLFCRPKKYEHVKETKEHVMTEYKNNVKELAELEPIIIPLSDGMFNLLI